MIIKNIFLFNRLACSGFCNTAYPRRMILFFVAVRAAECAPGSAFRENLFRLNNEHFLSKWNLKLKRLKPIKKKRILKILF